MRQPIREHGTLLAHNKQYSLTIQFAQWGCY